MFSGAKASGQLFKESQRSGGKKSADVKLSKKTSSKGSPVVLIVTARDFHCEKEQGGALWNGFFKRSTLSHCFFPPPSTPTPA